MTRPLLLTAVLAASTLTVPAVAQASGSRAGATRAARQHVIAHIRHAGISLSTRDLDVNCSSKGSGRWICFVYANGGQCAGTLTEVYRPSSRSYRPRNVRIGCGE